MADLERALEWARQHPDDERAKRLIELTGNGQITKESVQAKDIASEQAELNENPEEKGFFARLKDQFEKRVENVSEIQNNEEISAGGKAFQTFGQGVAAGVVDPLNEVVSTALSAAVPDFIEEPIKKQFEEQVGKFVQSGEFQAAVENYNKFKEAHPEIAGDLEAVGNILNAGAVLTPAGRVTQVAGKGIAKTAEIAAEGVAKTASGAGKVGQFATSQATGLSPSTLKQIIDTPGAFTKEEMAKIDAGSIANKVKTALDKRIDELGETGKEYQTIRESGEVVNLRPDTITGVLDKYKINLGEDGKISLTAESPALSQGDVAALERFIGQYGQPSEMSANAFLNARRGLSELSRYDASKTDLSDKIAREIRAAYDEQGKTQLTGLADLDAKYAPEVRDLTRLKKDFLNPDGSLKDNALSKLSTLTGANKEIILGRVEKLVPGITQDVNILKAIKDIEYAKGQKVGAYLRGGAGGFIVSGGNPVFTVLSAIMTSPQVAIPMIRAYGNVKQSVKGTVGGIIKKLKTGTELVGEEVEVFQDALNAASQKVQDRVKNIRPGLNIQEVDSNPDGSPRLPVETKTPEAPTKGLNQLTPDELKDKATARVKQLDEIISKAGPKLTDKLIEIRGELDTAKPTAAAIQKAEKTIEDYAIYLKGRKVKLNELRSLAKDNHFDEFKEKLKTLDNRYAIRLRNNEELAKEFFLTAKRS